MKKTLISTAILGGLLAVSAFAQATDKVDARRENQQDRIAQGVKSGQLTAGETAHLESKQAGLNKEIHTDRQANGGRLTSAERKQVNQQQNHLSRQIYRDKHNARVQPK